MDGKELSEFELETISPGEALVFGAVMAILVIAVMTVVVYKILRTKEGAVKLPGGWQFTWK